MSKGKLAKFADMETYENVFQYPYSVVEQVPFDMKGHWHEQYFHNGNPIVLELGCGKGEYTVGLAQMFPDVNFIGVDIKGARMWTGATQALTSTWFLNRYRHFLADGGFIHLKTDSNFLFTYTTCLVEKNHLPVLIKTTDLYATAPKDSIAASIQTYYESMWIARGLNIKYMKFCLPRDGELVEPDVEIELDDYRSYHRDKRSSKDKAR